jgi:arylsulfatase A-like enzyme
VAAWTKASFMSMMTGQLPAAHGCKTDVDALSPSMPTVPERLRQGGYYCAAVVSNPLVGAKFGFGRGFEKYDDYTVFLDAELALLGAETPGQYTGVGELVSGATVTRQAKRLLEAARKTGKPYFLFVHYFDPHDSYVPPAPYDRQFDREYVGGMDGRDIQSLRNFPPPPRDLEHLRARYDGEIAYEDAQVGQLLRAVDAAPEGANNTLVILVSDHGEAFGEHGKLLHGNSTYSEEVAVPMIWRWRGVLPAGRRVKTAVGTNDIAATLAELFRFNQFETIHARSLWPALLGGQFPDADIVSDKCIFFPMQLSLTRGNLRLHARFANSPDKADTEYELYDVSKDPGEKQNLLAADHPQIKSMKIALLRVWSQCMELRKQHNVDTPANQVKLDDKERRRIQGLGYTETPGKKVK